MASSISEHIHYASEFLKWAQVRNLYFHRDRLENNQYKINIQDVWGNVVLQTSGNEQHILQMLQESQISPKKSEEIFFSDLKPAVANKQIFQFMWFLQDSSTLLDEKFNSLWLAIKDLKTYSTLDLKSDLDKSMVVQNLSLDLMLELFKFNLIYKQNSTEAKAAFPAFEARIKNHIEKQSAVLGKYRYKWETIIKNILIALTGVGLLVIAANMAYTKLNHGHAALLFQPAKTHSANSVEKIMACSSMPALAAG